MLDFVVGCAGFNCWVRQFNLLFLIGGAGFSCRMRILLSDVFYYCKLIHFVEFYEIIALL